MLPIRDHNPSGRTPYVTYGLIIANIAFFLMYWPMMDDPQKLAAFFNEYAIIPAEVSHGRHLSGLFTSMFLHGGWLHLLGNMLFLWIFGDNLEDILGHLGYAVFYVACGLLAGLSQVVVDSGSQIPTVGASGAIAGVMGGYLLLFPRARVDILFIIIIFFKIFTVPAWVMLGLWFGIQLFGGFAADTGNGGVAYWAHAGGFLAGVVLIFPLWLFKGGPGYWNRNFGAPPHPEAKYDRSSVPRINRKRR